MAELYGDNSVSRLLDKTGKQLIKCSNACMSVHFRVFLDEKHLLFTLSKPDTKL